jgi:ABC-type histidine transport system ATPase subunit
MAHRFSPLLGQSDKQESYGTMCWIDSKMVWSHTTLKSGFRFRIILLLGVRALDALDPLMVGHVLELLREDALAGPTMVMRWASMA